MNQDQASKRESNRARMPGVTALIDAHIAAFGEDFTVLKCIDFETGYRSTRKGQVPYTFPDEMIVDDEITTPEWYVTD